MLIDRHQKRLEDFLAKQEEERKLFVRNLFTEINKDLNIVKGDEFLTRDFLEGMVNVPAKTSPKVPAEHFVMPGVYRNIDGLRVNVLFQNPSTELVSLEMLGTDYRSDNIQTISPGLFHRMFDREEVMEIKELTYMGEAQSQSKAWEESFSWPEVNYQFQLVAERFKTLAKSIDKKDSDAAHVDVLEVLFLMYILASRLRHNCNNDFADLHRALFAMTDRTEEDALQTQVMYRERGIFTEYKTIRIYDPEDMTKQAVNYYVTLSLMKHKAESGTTIPAGGFLPSHRALNRNK